MHTFMSAVNLTEITFNWVLKNAYHCIQQHISHPPRSLVFMHYGCVDLVVHETLRGMLYPVLFTYALCLCESPRHKSSVFSIPPSMAGKICSSNFGSTASKETSIPS